MRVVGDANDNTAVPEASSASEVMILTIAQQRDAIGGQVPLMGKLL